MRGAGRENGVEEIELDISSRPHGRHGVTWVVARLKLDDRASIDASARCAATSLHMRAICPGSMATAVPSLRRVSVRLFWPLDGDIPMHVLCICPEPIRLCRGTVKRIKKKIARVSGLSSSCNAGAVLAEASGLAGWCFFENGFPWYSARGYVLGTWEPYLPRMCSANYSGHARPAGVPSRRGW